MSLPEVVQNLLDDAVHRSLPAIRPELALCATIVCLLIVRMILPRWRSGAYWLAIAGAAAALLLLEPWRALQAGAPAARQEIFTGMLVIDGLSIFLRGLLLVFLPLFALLAWITNVPPREDATELFVLLFGAALGMCMMVSANHLVMVILGMEMASLPCYVLAGILKFRKPSTEAAMKFAVFGAGAAGIMLYGISLLAGVLGSLHLPTMAARLSLLLSDGLTSEQSLLLALGALMITVGLAFKLAAVPFHFWAPDVFDGAPAEVGALLSVASKAAAMGLLIRLAVGLPASAASAEIGHAVESPPATVIAAGATIAAGAMQPEAIGQQAPDCADNAANPPAHGRADITRVRRFIVGLLSLLAAVTCTFGNLAAYGQSNMKRLLAYSTIAHAGYLIMPVAAAVALITPGTGGAVLQQIEGDSPAPSAVNILAASMAAEARFAVASVLFYLGAYFFMNLAAFAITAILRNALGSEQIDDYAGLVRRSPALTVCTAAVMFSLVGLPPLAGFLAKFYIFAALVEARLWLLLAVGGLNTVLSLFYYLRVVRVMVLRPEPTDRPAPAIAAHSIGGLYCIAVTVPLVAIFFWSDTLMQWSKTAAASMF